MSAKLPTLRRTPTRRFKRFVGITPGEYRRISGAMPSRAASRREDARDSKTIGFDG